MKAEAHAQPVQAQAQPVQAQAQPVQAQAQPVQAQAYPAQQAQPVQAQAYPAQPVQQAQYVHTSTTTTTQYPQQHQQVVVTTGAMQPVSSPVPFQTVCPTCRNNVVTYVSYRFGGCAIVTMIIFFILFWPLMFMPLCCPASFQDVVHSCPACRAIIGIKPGGC